MTFLKLGISQNARTIYGLPTIDKNVTLHRLHRQRTIYEKLKKQDFYFTLHITVILSLSS